MYHSSTCDTHQSSNENDVAVAADSTVEESVSEEEVVAGSGTIDRPTRRLLCAMDGVDANGEFVTGSSIWLLPVS